MKIKVSLVCIPFWKLWGRICSQLISVVGRIQFLEAEAPRSLPAVNGGLFLASRACCLRPGALLLQSQQCLVESFSHSVSLLLLPPHLFDPLCYLPLLLLSDDLGPTLIIQENLSISRFLNLVIFAKSPLPCKVTYSHISGFRDVVIFGAGAGWGGRAGGIVLLTTLVTIY